MTRGEPNLENEHRDYRLAMLLFCGALVFHCWGATVGWASLNLPGCEFRQTQTAISAFFIQREHNFSLAYPTPVLGKPWSIPMEFPLYQWTVVWIANALKLPLTQAGRAVSLACFYLGLPALHLLLGRLGIIRSKRLLVMGLIVTCPLYVFYSRAFLIETMALMFGAWFLFAYVSAVEKRHWGWLLVAVAAGVGCGLVKVTTYLFFLMPAFLWTLHWFWQDWRQPAELRVRSLLTRVGWCALAVAAPFVASIWWVHYSDAIKALSVAGACLISGRMSAYNFGVGVRFSPDIWRQHWHILFHDLASVWTYVVCGGLALFFARRWWWLISVLVLLFFAVQVVFPVLYAWHEYYYVACAFAVMIAFGLAVCGVFDSRLPRVAVWIVVLLVYGLQVGDYFSYYYPTQKQLSDGGSNVTLALRAVTAPDDVVIIAGDDWNSMTPYYAERRAFMIRRNLETTWDIIVPALDQLKGEEVTALVLHGDQVKNHTLIEMVAEKFHIDPRPAFQWRDITVFLHEQIRGRSIPILKNIPDLKVFEMTAAEPDLMFKREINPAAMLPRFRKELDCFSPTPIKYFTTYGLGKLTIDGRDYFSAHPDTRFWFKIPAGQHTFSTHAGVVSAAYAPEIAPGDRSDGVEIRLEVELPNGTRQQLFSRLINPRDNPAERGILEISHSFELAQDSVVVLSVGPGPLSSYARDWTIMGPVEIK